MRRAATEPKTGLAGVILENSFARFRPSMAMLSEERTPSRFFGRLSLSAISKVGVRKGCGGKVVRRARTLKETKVHPVIVRRLVEPDAFGEANTTAFAKGLRSADRLKPSSCTPRLSFETPPIPR